MIAVLAFAQASVVLAACSMERGDMAEMAATSSGCCEQSSDEQGGHQLTNACVAHCTSDLQQPGPQAVIVRSPADVAVLAVAGPSEAPGFRTALAGPLPPAPPSRILLHSFQV
ncbi:MAG TPA: hypothetical protein VEB23_17075 [Ramlibacter sp.]|nr:hypothetical protein [Ramlibacter sp.]